ncbi:MAG: dTDP-glucose 4,6-dehydratase [bacterium]|nr:dTDP-glucose 4,6-dehydratase [bacterium]
MKLLVTGGSGFIGSNFILYWLHKYPNDHIINLDALTYAGHRENLTSIEKDPRYTFVHGDIRDKKVVMEYMRDIDAVVHFAAESHVDRSIVNPTAFVETNVLGTQVLLDAARACGNKRFHHVSTDEVFGSLALDEKRQFNEMSPYDPSSPYSASKAGSDFLVRASLKTYGLPITISHCSNNYGPRQTPEKLIPLMITNALADKPLPVYGDGLNVRDWIYVEDHCRGIELVIQKGRIGETYCIGGNYYVEDHYRGIELVIQKGRIGETYCIGGNAEKANIDLVKTILHILGKPESLITFVKDRPGHDRRYAIDSSKIAEELGYAPRFDFKQGLQETIAWYKNNEGWCKKVIAKII